MANNIDSGTLVASEVIEQNCTIPFEGDPVRRAALQGDIVKVTIIEAEDQLNANMEAAKVVRDAASERLRVAENEFVDRLARAAYPRLIADPVAKAALLLGSPRPYTAPSRKPRPMKVSGRTSPPGVRRDDSVFGDGMFIVVGGRKAGATPGYVSVVLPKGISPGQGDNDNITRARTSGAGFFSTEEELDLVTAALTPPLSDGARPGKSFTVVYPTALMVEHRSDCIEIGVRVPLSEVDAGAIARVRAAHREWCVAHREVCELSERIKALPELKRAAEKGLLAASISAVQGGSDLLAAARAAALAHATGNKVALLGLK